MPEAKERHCSMDSEDSSDWEESEEGEDSDEDCEMDLQGDQRIGVPMHEDAVRRGRPRRCMAPPASKRTPESSDECASSEEEDESGSASEEGSDEAEHEEPKPIREHCWLCTFCGHPKAKDIASFICANSYCMSTSHMASQIKDKITEVTPIPKPIAAPQKTRARS